MASSTRTIVISDIHIGTNVPTCWYQQKYHEPYLTALFDWVQDHADEIGELIILGDLFDFWTYPPDQSPPTTDAIVKANPTLLGPGGKLSSLLDALGGRVVYLHGNHDINLTQEDLNRIGSSQHKIQLVDDVYVKDEVVYTHGHLFTMFNAPSPGNLPKLPLGHFVTRCISHMLEQKQPGKTAADLPDQGAPYGADWENLMKSFDPLKKPGDFSVAATFLNYIAGKTGMDKNQPIKLLDGTETSIAQAKKAYDGLWTAWVEAFGGNMPGQITAYKAARADYDGSYLGWFAERLRRQKGARAVVMGHTHLPRRGLRSKGSKPCVCDSKTMSCVSEYYNGGFLCPSRPDFDHGKRFTFTSIGPDQQASQLMQVVSRDGSFQVEPFSSAHSEWIVGSGFDYSCYIEVENRTDRDLERVGPPSAEHGYYALEPPELIRAGTKGFFWLQDFPGTQGTKGSIEYAPKGGGASVTLRYACPFRTASNSCSGAPFTTRVAERPWGKPNHVDKIGFNLHPFFVAFTVNST